VLLTSGPYRRVDNGLVALTIFIVQLDVDMLEVVSADLVQFPEPSNASLPGTRYFAQGIRRYSVQGDQCIRSRAEDEEQKKSHDVSVIATRRQLEWMPLNLPVPPATSGKPFISQHKDRAV
jgi:hypothetical protein